MKKLINLFFIFILVGCTCRANGEDVCLRDGFYAVEENAELTLSVENEAYGEQIVALWDKEYPEHTGAITYTVKNAAEIFDQYLDYKIIDQDVFLAKDDYVPTYFPDVLELEDDLFEHMDFPPVESYYQDIAESENVYVPMNAEGMVFGYNLTMLEAAGYDETYMESFEIMSEMKMEQIYFHMNHPYYVYPFISNGLKLFENSSVTGFESESFLNALQSFKALYDTLRMKNDPSHIDNYFIDQSYVCGLIGSWMQYDESEKHNNIDLKFTKMPTYKENQLTPLSNSYGYLIKKDTKYPGAATALMQLLRSQKGIQIYIDTTEGNPLLLEEDYDKVTFVSDNRKELSMAYLYSKPQPLWSMNGDSTSNIIDIYYKSDILDNIQDYMDNKINLKETRENIIAEAKRYMNE